MLLCCYFYTRTGEVTGTLRARLTVSYSSQKEDEKSSDASIDKILLLKRAIIESVNDYLKNICQIEHSRHRSPLNFLVNLLAGLVAYTYLEKKPSLDLDSNGFPALSPAAF